MGKSWNAYNDFYKEVEKTYGEGAFEAARKQWNTDGSEISKEKDALGGLYGEGFAKNAEDYEGTYKYWKTVFNLTSVKNYMNAWSGGVDPNVKTDILNNRNHSFFSTGSTGKRRNKMFGSVDNQRSNLFGN